VLYGIYLKLRNRITTMKDGRRGKAGGGNTTMAGGAMADLVKRRIEEGGRKEAGAEESAYLAYCN
jgi:hypothetical protein